MKHAKGNVKMRDKPDHYAMLAKKEGYPARSVYKLQEIQQKFSVIPRQGKVLDIGAAPGSWSLYVSRLLKGKGSVTAVDLQPLHPDINPENLYFFLGDAFSEEFKTVALQNGPYNAIISDAAPSTTGNRTVDTGRSYTLAVKVIETAARLLLSGGNLVIKIFQGGDEQELLSIVKKGFAQAKLFKPKASRKESFEIFLIGKEKK